MERPEDQVRTPPSSHRELGSGTVRRNVAPAPGGPVRKEPSTSGTRVSVGDTSERYLARPAATTCSTAAPAPAAVVRANISRPRTPIDTAAAAAASSPSSEVKSARTAAAAAAAVEGGDDGEKPSFSRSQLFEGRSPYVSDTAVQGGRGKGDESLPRRAEETESVDEDTTTPPRGADAAAAPVEETSGEHAAAEGAGPCDKRTPLLPAGVGDLSLGQRRRRGGGGGGGARRGSADPRPAPPASAVGGFAVAARALVGDAEGTRFGNGTSCRVGGKGQAEV